MVEFFTLMEEEQKEQRLPPEKMALELLRHFSPNVLTIPRMHDIERIAKERHIIRTLVADPSQARVRQLAQFHSERTRDISQVLKSAAGLRITDLREKAKAGHPPAKTVPIKVRRVRAMAPKTVRDAVGQLYLF